MVTNITRTKDRSLKEYFNDFQVVYVASIQELIRQVSIYNQEIGRLITKIWANYLYLIQIVEKELTLEKEQEITAGVDEASRIHRTYQRRVNVLKQRIAQVQAYAREKDAVNLARSLTNTYLNRKRHT
jgi:hypothetical protein